MSPSWTGSFSYPCWREEEGPLRPGAVCSPYLQLPAWSEWLDRHTELSPHLTSCCAVREPKGVTASPQGGGCWALHLAEIRIICGDLESVLMSFTV